MCCNPAGGLLVVPVLQPTADNIPFGLALSLQSRVCASVCGASVEDGQQDLYELQYVLEGTGQASARSRQLQDCAVLSRPSERCSWQLLQLRAKSGVLQNVAAGDSILAPVGRAWCQLADEVTLDSNLAVLKLLVPGNFPHKPANEQGNNVNLRLHCIEQTLLTTWLTSCQHQDTGLAHYDTNICHCRSD